MNLLSVESLRDVVDFLRASGGDNEAIDIWHLVIALSLSLICVTIVSRVYRFTHRGVSYSQSFVQTLILTSLVTTVIMIVIGSNIARAFSLVGALSIIRFRNAVKETRDVSYIFFAMAVAMACGTHHYMVAIVGTAFICCVMLVLYFTDFGKSKSQPERMLRVRLQPNQDPDTLLAPAFQQLFDEYTLILVETVRQGALVEALYSVRMKPNVEPQQVLNAISELNSNLPVTFTLNTHRDEL